MTGKRLGGAAINKAVEVTEVANPGLPQELRAKAVLSVSRHGVLKTFPVVRQADRHMLQPVVAEVELCGLDAVLEDLAVLFED